MTIFLSESGVTREQLVEALRKNSRVVIYHMINKEITNFTVITEEGYYTVSIDYIDKQKQRHFHRSGVFSTTEEITSAVNNALNGGNREKLFPSLVS